jgi:hypothetical protein
MKQALCCQAYFKAIHLKKCTNLDIVDIYFLTKSSESEFIQYLKPVG